MMPEVSAKLRTGVDGKLKYRAAGNCWWIRQTGARFDRL